MDKLSVYIINLFQIIDSLSLQCQLQLEKIPDLSSDTMLIDGERRFLIMIERLSDEVLKKFKCFLNDKKITQEKRKINNFEIQNDIPNTLKRILWDIPEILRKVQQTMKVDDKNFIYYKRIEWLLKRLHRDILQLVNNRFCKSYNNEKCL